MTAILYQGYTSTKAHANLDGLWDQLGVLNYPAQPGELGVVATNWPVGHAHRYGAMGGGLNDETAKLQKMLDALGVVYPKGGEGVIPPGNYKTTAPLVLPASNAFINSSKHRVTMHGATIFSYDQTPGRAVFRTPTFIGQEGKTTFEGGTIDGSHAHATVNGFELHSNNTRLIGMVIRYFDKGITFVNDLAAPPICCSVDACHVQLNRIGIHSDVPTSLLVITNSRIEGNDEQGCWFKDAGKVTMTGNTVETNGFVDRSKPNLQITGGVDFYIAGNYFESIAYQGHSCVLIDAVAIPGIGGAFIANRVVGYYETAPGSGVPLLTAIGLDIAGGAGGAVETVVAHGNWYAGMYIGVRINTNARGFSIGPDNFADNMAPSFVTPPCIRYDMLSSNGGVVYDHNRYANTTYHFGTHRSTNLAATSTVSAPTGIFGPSDIGGTEALRVNGAVRLANAVIFATSNIVPAAGIPAIYRTSGVTSRLNFRGGADAQSLRFLTLADSLAAWMDDNGRWIFGSADPGGVDLVRINGGLTINAALLLRTKTNLTDATGAAAGTLTNAPTAGNPSKWITIDDNGTIRKIPTWQ